MMKSVKILSIFGLLSLFFFVNAEATMTVYNIEGGILYSDNIVFVKADDSGSIWIGLNSFGLMKFHKQSAWTSYRSPLTGLMNNLVTDINFDAFDNYENDSSGGIWISTQFGLSRFNGTLGWDSLNSEDSLLYTNIRHVAVDNDNYVWLGTYNAGLVRYNRDSLYIKDSTFVYYSSIDGLLDNRVLSLYIDESNNIWAGGYNGISRFNLDSGWTNYTSTNSGLLDDTINDITQDISGNLWIATSTGLNKLSTDSVWTTYNEGNNCPYSLGKVTAVTIDSLGNIWIGSDMKERNNIQVGKFNGVSHWEIANIDNDSEVEFKRVTDITTDNNGDVWVATNGEGLTKISGNPTSVTDNIDGFVPSKFSMSQNYPNPFNLATTIEYTLPKISEISIAVYNVTGQKIAELFEGVKSAGHHSIVWNGTNVSGDVVSTGIYFYQIKSKDFSDIKKMVLLK